MDNQLIQSSWRQILELNQHCIGGRQALLPLHHPLLPWKCDYMIEEEDLDCQLVLLASGFEYFAFIGCLTVLVS